MKTNLLKIGFFAVLTGFSFLATPNSYAGEKQPMAVLCPSGLNFYTVCGGEGGGCSETKCDTAGDQ